MANDTIHIDLSEFVVGGDTYRFPDQWIDVADPGYKTPRQFKAIVTLASSTEEGASGKLLAALVRAWHITSESGEALPAPNDVDADDIPLAIAKRFTDVVMERITNLGSPFRG